MTWGPQQANLVIWNLPQVNTCPLSQRNHHSSSHHFVPFSWSHETMWSLPKLSTSVLGLRMPRVGHGGGVALRYRSLDRSLPLINLSSWKSSIQCRTLTQSYLDFSHFEYMFMKKSLWMRNSWKFIRKSVDIKFQYIYFGSLNLMCLCLKMNHFYSCWHFPK